LAHQVNEIFEQYGFDVSLTSNLFVKEDYFEAVYAHLEDDLRLSPKDALKFLGGGLL
jgi:hypothetical protein